MILRNRQILLGVLLLSLVLGAGCETTKGFATGVATGVASTATGAAKDATEIWQGFLRIDSWMRENLW
ncbi:MAG: hypothetical protein ABIG31_00800 [Candidatus Omnitrophota bacterium]